MHLTRIATPQNSRNDVLILAEMRRTGPQVNEDLEEPGLLFDRLTSSQRHFHILTSLASLRGELRNLSRVTRDVHRTHEVAVPPPRGGLRLATPIGLRGRSQSPRR